MRIGLFRGVSSLKVISRGPRPSLGERTVLPTAFSESSQVHLTEGARCFDLTSIPSRHWVRAHCPWNLPVYARSYRWPYRNRPVLSTQRLPPRSVAMVLVAALRLNLFWHHSHHHRNHFAYHRSKDETRAGVEGIADLLLTDSVTRVYSADPSD
jgi:hypothetical protein